MIFRITCITAWLAVGAALASADDALFRDRVAPVLRRHCLNCHNDEARKGGLSLQTSRAMLSGGDSGEVIYPGDPDSSYLLDLITPEDGKAEMPEGTEPLSEEDRAAIRDWIAAGANWPRQMVLEPEVWWSFRTLVQPKLPELPDDRTAWCKTPIDRFVARKHQRLGLTPAKEADRATLIRRLYFDLIGLPPTPEEVEAFVAAKESDAYSRLVDRLLASKQYGERWARHWLDVVHYGETHGYDKDKLRVNAWPYRDYVIRSLNQDKPYGRFIEEQIAGDVLYPDSVDGIEALGFIAAGPWDFIGHAEVPATKTDGKVARHLDRDDMVRNTTVTFLSVTVGCAQCHDHKFDPITQEDYYSLQAVFAALDRADREYYDDPALTHRRDELLAQKRAQTKQRDEILATIKQQGGEALAKAEQAIKTARKAGSRPPEYGYHSAIEASPEVEKWVQVDLGADVAIDRIESFPCHDDFNGIGAGFGFPRRYKIELAADAAFTKDVRVVVDHTTEDIANPGTVPLVVDVQEQVGRFVRITATKLATRQNDYIFAIAELKVFDAANNNLAAGQPVAAQDSIEQGVRWGKRNLVDGLHPGAKPDPAALAALVIERDRLLEQLVDTEMLQQRDVVRNALAETTHALEALPPTKRVYAGMVYYGSGAFRGTGPDGGRPRAIHILPRGDVKNPGEEVTPGAISSITALTPRFTLPDDAPEGLRRAALARWIASKDNPLTWRSIVNRLWQYHFGRGLVNTPGDFGRMGEMPTHPELLDWLAVRLRDGGGSLKDLHRLIVNSAVYRQSSSIADCPQCHDAAATDDPRTIDSGNRYLWRMNRRQLEAEAIRDAILFVSGKLNMEMGGPSFQDFVIEKPEHSPHYQYDLHDPEDPRCHRRSIYRFLVRSQTQPFMTVMDCADPSIMVNKRNQTITPLQALSMLNNKLSLVMAKHFAARVRGSQGDVRGQMSEAYKIALGRPPTPDELEAISDYATAYGLANACRVILNLNEFVFVD